MMYFRNKLLFIVSCCLLLSISCYAQKKADEVVYYDYSKMETNLLDSLKKDGMMTFFGGIQALRKQAQQVKENNMVIMTPRRAEKKHLTPEEIICKSRASVLTINKYGRTLNGKEAVMGWATAVVLSEEGICVSNYHVFWELLEPSVKLNPNDSIMFVATEEGKVYPITEILSFNKNADFAIFKIDTHGEVLTPISMGNDLSAGRCVHLLSHPEGYPYSYTNGVVMRTSTTDVKDPFARRMEMTADFAKGSSGGPVMDDCGNMVGMVSSIRSIYYMTQPPYHLQMNIKLCIPISSLKQIINLKDE